MYNTYFLALSTEGTMKPVANDIPTVMSTPSTHIFVSKSKHLKEDSVAGQGKDKINLEHLSHCAMK